jgi:predicted secreted protein
MNSHSPDNDSRAEAGWLAGSLYDGLVNATPPPEELDVNGVAGEPIELPITTGPATGHEWLLELPPGVQQIDEGPARPVDPGHRLGGAEGGQLRVTAPRGEHEILARLARPWEPGQPVRVARIRLHVH